MHLSTFNNALVEYGFIMPEKIVNLDASLPQPDFKYPVGIIRGDLKLPIPTKNQIEIANITCAACHSSRTFDKTGKPTNQMWLGASSSSINLNGYTTEIYESFKFMAQSREAFFKNLKVVYPDISDLEYKTIKQFAFFEIQRQIETIEKNSDKVLSFYNGPAGMANAIGSFKRVFGIYSAGYYTDKEVGSVNIPDMSYKKFKTNYTVDGIYTPLNKTANTEITETDMMSEKGKSYGSELGKIAAIFPIPVQGVQADKTESLIPDFEKIFDRLKALEGEKLFRQSCMKCHGEFSAGVENVRLISYPNKKIDVDVIGTDPERIDAISPKLKNFLYSSWIPQKIQVNFDRGYMAPILANIWMTAPYLHNGSVPSLWALMNPSERPEKFYVGGHSLDFKTVGITYPSNVVAKSLPTLVDTTKPGYSNKGHEKMFLKLSADDKWKLIEYLKLL
jgi:mono/diheme cytochrome c family protein